MEKANSLSLGSAAYAAKRGADITFVLLNKMGLDDASLTAELNEALRDYDETGRIKSTDLKDLETVAHKLLAVFSAPNVEKAAHMLNALLKEHANAPRLSNHGGSAWHIHVDSDDHTTWSEWLATSSALALAILLAEKGRNPGGLCASSGCGRPFIDLGKGGGRSYCSPRCATRERVAAYRNRA